MTDNPELRWVPVKDLYVDKAYQRSTETGASKKNLKAMVNDFQCLPLVYGIAPGSG